jgi:hypothetical protein
MTIERVTNDYKKEADKSRHKSGLLNTKKESLYSYLIPLK